MPPSLSTRRPWRRRALGAAALLWACLGGPPASAAAPETASLRIQGPPRVEVAWEGVPLGTIGADGTLSIAGIPPGVYELVFSRPGFASRPWRLEVEPGSGELVIDVDPLVPAAPEEEATRQRDPEGARLGEPVPARSEEGVVPPVDPPPPADRGADLAPDLVPEPAPEPVPEPPFEPASEPPSEPPSDPASDPASEPAFEPEPHRTPRRAEPAAADPGPPSTGPPSSGALLVGLALLALAAGGAAAAVLLRRRRPSAPPRPPVQRFLPPVARGSAENPRSAELLEKLRRQERELEWKVYGFRGVRQPEVIDVDDLPVRDEQGPEEEHG